MSEKLLSIVIPTYNMEQYLPQCLDSITREDVPDTLEAIVVNDGSTDHSLEIAKRYQEKRPDIIQIIDKPNGHYGSCVNAALKIATGKYFRPLDADDWFDTDALISLLSKLSVTSTDLIITSRTEITDTHTFTYRLPISEEEIKKTDELRAIPFSDLDCIISMHSFSYKTSLLHKINLKLQEKICYTDTEFYLIPLQYSQQFVYFNFPLYQYRFGREGQSMNTETFKKNRHHLVLILIRLIQEISLIEGSIEYNRLYTLLISYFGTTLFDIPTNKNDNKDMKSILHLVKAKNHVLWEEINKKLFFVPRFWLITKKNFYFYTRIKKKLGIKA